LPPNKSGAGGYQMWGGFEPEDGNSRPEKRASYMKFTSSGDRGKLPRRSEREGRGGHKTLGLWWRGRKT